MKRFGDRVFHGIAAAGAAVSALLVLFVLFYIVKESMPFLSAGAGRLFDGKSWSPLAPEPSFSIVPMIAATAAVSLLAVVMALPVGLGCAFFLSFCVSEKPAKTALAFIDMLAGVPSVIFGFVGLAVLVKWMEKTLDMATGESVLAGGILLAVMLLPYFVTGCYETIEKGKELYGNASLSLGVSSWYTMRHVILPFSKGSIAVNTLLALGRAMGETMAVMMVMGNSPVFPKLLGRSETIPSLIALEMGTASYKSDHYAALYSAALVLMGMLLVIQITARILEIRFGRREDSHEAK